MLDEDPQMCEVCGSITYAPDERTIWQTHVGDEPEPVAELVVCNQKQHPRHQVRLALAVKRKLAAKELRERDERG